MRRLLLPAALAAALFAGCGDDDDGGGNTTTEAGARVVRIAADEYSFDPKNVVYDAGGRSARFTIALDNRGALAHNLKLFAGDRELGGTPTFQGGQTETGAVALEPGDYRMVCTVGDHEQLGMTGRLEVR